MLEQVVMGAPKKVRRLLIADDHPLFRSGLEQLLELRLPDASIVCASDVAELQSAISNEREFDAVLLDLHMPGAQGFSALVWLTHNHRDLPIIVVSANTHPHTVRSALDHGAAAFLSKSTDPNLLLDNVESVLGGARGLHPGLEAADRATDLDTLDVADALGQLTPSQFRVASMLAEGLLNKQIAFEIDVTEATVKAHMTEIFKKLRVRSRTQAVLALSALSLEPHNADAIGKPKDL